MLSDTECCSALGSHFKSVFINDNHCKPTNNVFNLNIPLMQDISINTLDAYKTITKLSNKNTIRPDNISLLFIKNFASS